MTATETKVLTPPRPRIDAPDIELLQAFEPVVRYTRGEAFLPMSVATYLAAAVRMTTDGSGHHQPLGEEGAFSEVTLVDEATDGVPVRDFMTVAGTGAETMSPRSSGPRAGRRSASTLAEGGWRASESRRG